MIVGVTGKRDFHDYQKLCAALDHHAPTGIISGGCAGADTMAKRYANEHGIPFTEYLPRFKTDPRTPYHPRWYLKRNEDIVDNCEKLVAFWDGMSKGTGYTVKYAQKQGKDVAICKV